MPPKTRSAISKAPVKTAAVLPEPSPWREAQWLLAFLFGLVGIALVYVAILSESEVSAFGKFLRGQVGLAEMFSSLLYLKVAFGLALGAVAGFFLGAEIPRREQAAANGLARWVALFVIPVVIYIPAMSAGFIWDDDQEITANPSLQTNYGLWEIWTGGLSNMKEAKPTDPLPVKLLRPPLAWIERQIWGDGMKAHCSADYFPLKTTMLWIEYQLWGHEPNGAPRSEPFHIMNILIHALDALLLYLVLRQLNVPGAWLGSLLFAIHPVHVESVAWIAERKNTLSLFFYLLSISAWLRFEKSEKRSSYIWALIFCAAALLCKTHVVVLPAVLLLITWWKKGTLTVRDGLRTIPFFAVSLALALVTIWFQNGRAIGEEVIPIGDWPSRIAGAGVVVWSYLSKVILPVELNTIYANTWYLWWPLKDPAAWMYLAGAAVLATLGALLMVGLSGQKERAARTPFFVFAYFVGLLFPVLGLFKMSYMRLTLQADHFQYFSDISIIACVGALIALAIDKMGEAFRPILVGATALMVLAMSAYSWERAGVHQSEKTLWTACLEKNNDSWQAHNHLGAVFYMEGRKRAAAPHFARAVALKPANPEVHNNLGLVLWDEKRFDEAIFQYSEAVRIKGDVPAMRRNYADALNAVGRYEEALVQYKRLVEDVPKDPGMHAAYGVALARVFRLADAERELEIAFRINPNDPAIRQNLAAVRQAMQGKSQ